jgi:glycosyltransferase involved in cell wall biosynthesis
VVVTNVGDLMNIVRQAETGFVVEDNEPRQLAEKIALVLNGHIRDIGNVQPIRASVARFGWQNVAGSFLEEAGKLVGVNSESGEARCHQK